MVKKENSPSTFDSTAKIQEKLVEDVANNAISMFSISLKASDSFLQNEVIEILDDDDDPRYAKISVFNFLVMCYFFRFSNIQRSKYIIIK